jgi:hypothetical protein
MWLSEPHLHPFLSVMKFSSDFSTIISNYKAVGFVEKPLIKKKYYEWVIALIYKTSGFLHYECCTCCDNHPYPKP